MGKKPFIDRKTATTFHLVHRSQRDPLLVTDAENASSRVFAEVRRGNAAGGRKARLRRPDGVCERDDDADDDDDDLGRHVSKGAAPPRAKNPNAGEAALYGVYFNDTEYDYTQHLKPTGLDRTAVLLEAPAGVAKEKQGLQGLKFADESVGEVFEGKKVTFQLPGEVLPSAYELEVGLLNREAIPEGERYSARSALLFYFFPPLVPVERASAGRAVPAAVTRSRLDPWAVIFVRYTQQELRGLQPDMDPALREALVALDDDEYVVKEDELGDGYFAAIAAEGGVSSGEEEYAEEEEDDEVDDLGGWRELQRFKKMAASARTWSDDEDNASQVDAKSTGTMLSMSSSAMFRNEKLQLLDERFDRVEEMYNDSDSEDDEDKENFESAGADPENLDDILDEFLDKFDVVGRKMVAKPEGASAAENVDAVRRQLGGARLDEHGENDDSDSEEARLARDEEIMAMLSKPKRPDWDCQSVLCECAASLSHPVPSDRIDGFLHAHLGETPCSHTPLPWPAATYSNLENHPAMIRDRNAPRIRIGRNGMPRVEQLSPQVIPEEEEAEEDAGRETFSADGDTAPENKGAARRKDESAEERRARKLTVKAERRGRRTEKKAAKEAFRSEAKREERRAEQKSAAAACVRLG
ncbi:MAG: Low temperature viability protein-domain-containing protein [Olpidium bornovanus]|uniref:Low temperature viability protein-domain-containing protein n=1 Tax=Olpidium bornovanus TaxID=278681 RepID=A0A8H7ZM88_9FUNG|nr:MAG: Low temperature viability protein-domain-containing protein [Olpidium bornovanus]